MKIFLTVKEVERMRKFYLISSFFFLGFCPSVFSQDAPNLEASKPDTLIIDSLANQVHYPGKPLIMSLVLPGAGQFYNQSPLWKTASFVGVELVSIFAWNYFQKEAEKRRDEYQNFADLNWTLDNWVTNRFNYPDQEQIDGRIWSSFPALTKLSGTHDLKLIISGDLANDLNLTRVSSDSLDIHPEWFYSGDIVVVRDRHFYENIGKYDQFVGGWNDARENWYWEEKDVGDSTEIVIKTPMKQKYIEDRYDSNQMLNAAKYSVTVLMFNHVLSGIESIWGSQKKGKERNAQQTRIDSKINLVYNPQNPLGVGGLKFSVYF